MVVLAVAVGLTAAACGDDTEPTAGEQAPAVVPDDGLVPFCDDVATPGPVAQGDLAGSANPDEILLGVLQTYADDHADTFGGLWIDRSAGSIVLAFTDDPEPHRAAIAELRPSPDDVAVVEPRPEITETTTVAESGTTVGLVQVAHTEAEQMALGEELADSIDGELGIIGVGVKTDLNRVTVMLRLADAETRAAVAELGPIDALCVDGPAEAPVPIDPATVDLLTVGDDPLVTCAGFTFPLSGLDAPTDLLDSDDPLAEALRDDIPSMDPGGDDLLEIGWRVLVRTESDALVTGGDPPSLFVRMVLEDGRWRSEQGAAGEPCVPRRAVPDGLEAVRWSLDPAHPQPGPDDTQLHVLVSGSACSGGEPLGERLVGPQVELTDDEVVVAFAATPLPAGAYTCPSNPADVVVVTLDEPIGDRTIVDGFDLPPRPPVGTGHPGFG